MMTGRNSQNLFRGCVREALASANGVARYGVQDTRAFDEPMRYVVDDTSGSRGLIEFSREGVVAAISARDPRPGFDLRRALHDISPATSAWLGRLCELPFFANEKTGITAIFWSNEGVITSPESWRETLSAGAWLFENEMMTNEAWTEQALDEYDLDANVAQTAIAIAMRAEPGRVTLSQRELDIIIPPSMDDTSTAMSYMLDGGAFTIA